MEKDKYVGISKVGEKGQIVIPKEESAIVSGSISVYQQFIDTHKKYYHPSNSYIFLYGDMNLEKCLKFINDGEKAIRKIFNLNEFVWLGEHFFVCAHEKKG